MRSHASLLPPDYTTLTQLERLHGRFPKIFDQWIEDDRITPSLQRNEISKILRLAKVKAEEKRVLRLKPIIGKFRTLVLDPAWNYEWLSIAARAKPGYCNAKDHRATRSA